MSKEFEIARILLVQGGQSGTVRAATAYAWSERLYPALHATRLDQAFGDDFRIDAASVSLVMKALDDADLANQPLSFYELENTLGGKHGHLGPLDREMLIAVLRYISLEGRFSSSVWNELTRRGSGPVESQHIAEEFNAARDLSLSS